MKGDPSDVRCDEADKAIHGPAVAVAGSTGPSFALTGWRAVACGTRSSAADCHAQPGDDKSPTHTLSRAATHLAVRCDRRADARARHGEPVGHERRARLHRRTERVVECAEGRRRSARAI